MNVVPLPSARCTTEIAAFGRVTPGFREVMFASFQFVMVPRKMSPRTWPVRFNPDGIPGRLYAAVTAPIVSGIWRSPGARDRSVAFSGASLAPKSTVFAVIWEIPAPLPTDA